jgi:hypothetical protein
LTHRRPAAHHESFAHWCGQLPKVPLHTKVPHDGDPALPAGRLVHVPSEPGRLHASHPPLHAALQQTPSVQKPEEHCELLWHEVPLACPPATHSPLTHWKPAAHHESFAHWSGHTML